jgi:hypothetical protein
VNEPTFDVEKSHSVVYVDGLGREHEALVTAVNGLHPGLVTLVFVDVNAPEPENVKKIFDVAHMSQITEPNPDLPNYQVNCWKEFYENHRALPADHPAFDHPAKAAEYDEQGSRIVPERPLTMADVMAHQESKCASAEAGIPCNEPEAAHTPEAARMDVGMDHNYVAPSDAAQTSAPVIETKEYSDGSSATGVAPLPDQSPAQQEAAEQAASAPEPDVTQMLDAAPPAPIEPAPPAEEGSTE